MRPQGFFGALDLLKGTGIRDRDRNLVSKDFQPEKILPVECFRG